ncbi:MAG: cytochrome CBB3 [Phycisphaerae bacterium]|nr:MAG: cytochrome CBB3 [Phycisphaerae bacterium]
MADTHDHLSDHEYDGIREYDNPTPAWWHVIFLGSVLFAAVYFLYFGFNRTAPTIWSQLAAQQTAENKRIFGALGNLNPDEPTMRMLMGDPKFMNVGRSQFQATCAQCHAKDGGGLNGVNLTDDHYKNVATMPDLFKVISEGAGSGAMPAWKNYLSTNERVLLAAYVASLRGTTPAGGKPPEGNPIPPW